MPRFFEPCHESRVAAMCPIELTRVQRGVSDIQVVRIPWENVGSVCEIKFIVRDQSVQASWMIETFFDCDLDRGPKTDYHHVDLAGGNHTMDLADWYLGFGNPVGKIRLHVAMARARCDRKNSKLKEILAYV
ncbi:hypothetical protein E3N88_29232 [Mikania micrantha]|uniref:Uncharacterized protein n=1 Tax=Mikania micrantha TaxID=192012 RepID=A0A5N6MJ54_9ASTR|nr:hypothetical protein E3N88_29232 [Mikania micrantha]